MLLLVTLAAALATQPCNAATHLQQAQTLQNRLFSIPELKDDMPIDAPPAAQRDIPAFHEALSAAVSSFMQCDGANITDPTTIQARLVTLLRADQPKSANEQRYGYPDHTYGDDLTVEVKPLTGAPNTLAIEIWFSIGCGQDSNLLLFRREGAIWRRTLDWHSDRYTKPSDAFGGIYLYALVPGPNSAPALAILHGHPWCSSVHSGFSLDLIKPATETSPQHVLDHLTHSYVIDDGETMKRTADGLQLHLTVESDDSSIIFHPGVLRYRTVSGKFELLPVARNARDFVDAWLQEPWATVANWSAPTTLEALHQNHNDFDYSLHKDGAGVPSLTFGPVRVCTSSSDHFQVELGLENATTQETPPLYAGVRQNPDSFTMLAITPKSDPTCAGPNLMRKP